MKLGDVKAMFAKEPAVSAPRAQPNSAASPTQAPSTPTTAGAAGSGAHDAPLPPDGETFELETYGRPAFIAVAPVVTPGAPDPRGAVIIAKFLDREGTEIPPPYDGWQQSDQFGPYRYVQTVSKVDYDAGQLGPDACESQLRAPTGAARVRLTIKPWRNVGAGVFLPAGVALAAASSVARADAPPDEDALVFTQRLFTDDPIFFSLTVDAQERSDEKGGVLRVEYFNDRGDLIPPPYPGLGVGDIGAFRYIAVPSRENGASDSFLCLPPPPGATEVRLEVRRWRSADPVKLIGAPTFSLATPDNLDAMFNARDADVGFAHSYVNYALWRGDPKARAKGLERIVRLSGDAAAARQLTHLAGAMRELSPTWFPSIPGSAKPRRSADTAGGMTICHLMKVCRPYEDTGGAVRNFNTVKSQRDAGLRPYVITPLGYPRSFGHEPTSNPVDVGGAPHYHLDIGPSSVRGWAPDRALHYEAMLAAGVFRRCGGALIHAASGYRGYDNALKGLALKRHFNVPLVYEVRSLHEHTWGPTRPDILDAPMTKLRIAQEDRCMAAADHVVTIAEAMRDVLEARGVAREKITVIPNAVEDDWFDPSSGGEVEDLRAALDLADAEVVGYISNLSAREGHSVLLKAYAKLVKERPRLRCLIVGEGSERANLERLAFDLGVSLGVIFTGNVPHEEIRTYYRLIDAFVVPRIPDFASDYVTPMKPFEALALERPLIMADRPVTKEILGDDAYGLSFRTGDHEHLAARIRETLDAPERSKDRARAGRDWVRRERNWSRNAAIYKDLYAEVAAAAATRSE